MFCYVLESKGSGRLYVGHAADLDSRLSDHNRGHVASTRGRGPWRIVYSETFDTRSAAAARERELKSWKSPGAIRALFDLLERPDDREGR